MQVPSLQPSPSCRGEVPVFHFAFSELTFFVRVWNSSMEDLSPEKRARWVFFLCSLLHLWGKKNRTKKENPPNVVLIWVISTHVLRDHIPEWAFPSPITPPHPKRGKKTFLMHNNAIVCGRIPAWKETSPPEPPHAAPRALNAPAVPVPQPS